MFVHMTVEHSFEDILNQVSPGMTARFSNDIFVASLNDSLFSPGCCKPSTISADALIGENVSHENLSVCMVSNENEIGW